jgi:hypothetical protein
MNIERMLQIADLIEANRDFFNMEYLGNLDSNESHVCGTPGCISGFVRAVMEDETDERPQYMAPTYEWLGLTMDQGKSLCLASYDDHFNSIWMFYAKELELPIVELFRLKTNKLESCVLIEKITPDMAIIMLRNLAIGKWSF